MKHEKRNQKASTFKPAEEKKNEFPGYPLYAPAEDIMNRGKRVNADLEDLDSVKSNIPEPISKLPLLSAIESVDKIDSEDALEAPDQFAVTSEDIEALGEKDLSMDMGDDEELKHRTTPVDFSGKDLDVPGVELDDEQESIGSEDEENNNYSLGGGNHNDLEESHS